MTPRNIFFAAVALSLFLQAGLARAATITVDELNDLNSTTGHCSLREAIEAADGNSAKDACPDGSGVDTIVLPEGTITITGAAGENSNGSGDFDIQTEGIIIQGAGVSKTFLQGGVDMATGIDRLLDINPDGGPGITVEIRDVTIRYGNVAGVGGAIRVCDSCTLILSDSAIEQNQTTDDGGGLYIGDSTTDLTNVTVTGNHANSDGGGLYAGTPTLSISQSIFSNNESGRAGGGLYNDGGTLTITTVVFNGNQSADDGGGFWTGGPTTMTDSTIDDNESVGRSGGVHTRSPLTIRNSTLSNNHAAMDGGVISVANATTVDIINSTLSGNSADAGGGAIGFDTSAGEGTLNLHNVTITNNTADADLSGGDSGGGISIADSLAAILNVENSIISGNRLGAANDECFKGTAGTITSGGFNVLGAVSASCDPSFGGNDLLGWDVAAILNPTLADNGGGTLTHLLLAGSPAIDGGNPAGCSDGTVTLTIDQRSLDRPLPAGGRCDIGAVEVGCGNGVVEATETCDDGNTDAADGCDAACQVECGNGTVDGTETCDDGNTENGDGCSSTCTTEVAPPPTPTCGDGTVDAGEECDGGTDCNTDCTNKGGGCSLIRASS